MIIHRNIHFYFGIIGIIIFLLTGQYMDKVHNHLMDMDDGPRMIFRSNHIYFLMMSIINIVFSLVPKHEESITKTIMLVIHALLFIVPTLILIGFFAEPFMDNLIRPYTRPAIYMTLGIGGLIVLNVFRLKFFKSK